MELRSEEKQEKENKGKKIIVASIIILIALIVIIGVAIVILKNEENKRMKLSVDGKMVSISSDLIITDDVTGKDYYSIKGLARLTGYDFFNGEYNKYSEDRTKCYVQSSNEIATLELDSNTIYKSNIGNELNFYEYKINNRIRMYGDSLYAASEDIQVIFNTQVQFNNSNNTITLYTLPYLANYYKSIVKNYGYTDISDSFNAQKALTKNLLVVNKDGKYGVVSTDRMNTIIGNKFEKIEYLDSTEEFIVTSGGKMGTLSLDGETKIGLGYDEIGLIDSNSKIYYAKNNNLYGVLNDNGKVLVYVQYEEIGINKEFFPMADIKNNLLLLGNCIPVNKDSKWGISDKNGNIIVDIIYDKLGYIEESLLPTENEGNNNNYYKTPTPTPTATLEKSINNVIVIPEIEGIVVGKNEKYGVISKIGKIIIPCEYDKIYSITNEGKEEVYLEKDGRTTKLSKYIEENRIKVEGNTTTNTSPIDTNTIVTNTVNSTTNSTTNNVVPNNTNTNSSSDKNEFVFVF